MRIHQLIIYMFLLGCSQESSDNIQERWVNKSGHGESAPSPRMPEALIWCGKNILLYGGQDFTPNHVSYFKDLWTFDPDKNKWDKLSPTGNLPPTLLGTRAVWTGKEALFYGGKNYDDRSQLTDTIWSYDPNRNQWGVLHPVGKTPPVREPAWVFWNGQEMVLFGGRGEKFEDYTDIWKYSLMENKWTEITQKSGTCEDALAGDSDTSGGDQRILFMNGDAEKMSFLAYKSTGYINRVLKFNFKTQKWQLLKVEGICPESRSGVTSVWTGKKLFLFGGSSGTEMGPQHILHDFFVYNYESNTWGEILNKEPYPEHRSTRAVWTGQEIFIFGGYSEHQIYLNDTWSYRPGAGLLVGTLKDKRAPLENQRQPPKKDEK